MKEIFDKTQSYLGMSVSKIIFDKGQQSGLFWIWINSIYIKNYKLTGKSLSEALLFAEHGENMLCTKIVLNVKNNFCTQHVFSEFELGIFMYWTCNSMNNLSSYCGLVDAKIRASDKDLLVFNVWKVVGTLWKKSFSSSRIYLACHCKE